MKPTPLYGNWLSFEVCPYIAIGRWTPVFTVFQRRVASKPAHCPCHSLSVGPLSPVRHDRPVLPRGLQSPYHLRRTTSWGWGHGDGVTSETKEFDLFCGVKRSKVTYRGKKKKRKKSHECRNLTERSTNQRPDIGTYTWRMFGLGTDVARRRRGRSGPSDPPRSSTRYLETINLLADPAVPLFVTLFLKDQPCFPRLIPLWTRRR